MPNAYDFDIDDGTRPVPIEGVHEPTRLTPIRTCIAPSQKQRAFELPVSTPQQTAEEVKCLMTAFSDAATLQGWKEIEGENAMMHEIPRSGFTVVLAETTTFGESHRRDACRDARSLLAGIEAPALMLLQLILDLVIARDRISISIDDLVFRLNLAPRTAATRLDVRRQVWRWLVALASTKIIGRRLRGRYRDERGNQLDLYSDDPLICILGTGRAEAALNHEDPPIEVTICAGEWLERFRGNRSVMPVFGDLETLLTIPCGTPAGAWARNVGLALQQRYREMASRVEIEYSVTGEILGIWFPHAFTRKELLSLFPCCPSVYELLEGRNPRRAMLYWDRAIAFLIETELVQSCTPREEVVLGRQGWQRKWLNEPLDILPTRKHMETIIEIRKRVKETGVISRPHHGKSRNESWELS